MPKPGDTVSRVFDLVIIALIVISIAAYMLETEKSVFDRAPRLFYGVELVCVVIFTLEYLIRLWCYVEDPAYSRSIRGRIRFALTPIAIIDLLAIAPFYITGFAVNLLFLRALRLLRLFRVVKLGRYSASVRRLSRVGYDKRHELFITFAVMSLLPVIASCLIYQAERDVQPEAFGSIPASMWWGINMLTKAGYGDSHPITTAGRFIASIVAILGIGLFALPAGILGSGLLQDVQRSKENERVCPHCGNKISQALSPPESSADTNTMTK